MIREITPEDCQSIRHQILRPNQPLDASLYPTDHDEGAFHLGYFFDGDLISIASFYRETHSDLPEQNQYRLRGMATLPEFRGRGAGRSLIQYSIAKLVEMQCEVLWCNARTSAADYYAKLGFLQIGDVFDLPPLGPHKVMSRRLSS